MMQGSEDRSSTVISCTHGQAILSFDRKDIFLFFQEEKLL